MAQENDTVWRGDVDGGFQEQAIGAYIPISDAVDLDNVYLSDQGWAYRHFTKDDKSEYWDEIIWSGGPTDPPFLNRPVGVFGAREQDFIFGNGHQFVSGTDHGEDDYKEDPVIGVVMITGPDEVEEQSPANYTATSNGDYDGTKTYDWRITRTDGTPDSANHTIVNGDQETATITLVPNGGIPALSSLEYVILCDVGGTDVDTETGSVEVEVTSTATPYYISSTYIQNHPSIFEINKPNLIRLYYRGNAPGGSVTPSLVSDDPTNISIVGPTGEGLAFGGGYYFDFDVTPGTGVTLGQDYTLTGNIEWIDAVDNDLDHTATTTFHCEGTIGAVNISRNPQGNLSANQETVVSLTSVATGAVGDQTDTTYQWFVYSVPGTASDKAALTDSLTTPTAQSTDITFPAGMELGNYNIRCTYSNPNMNPDERTGTINIGYL